MNGRRFLPTLLLGVALVAAGCYTGNATPSAVTCGHWCGDGSADVSFAGISATIGPGGCYDGGSAGIDARFGDWGPNGSGDYITVEGYRIGGATPSPVPTTAPDASPAASQPPDIAVAGSISGSAFALDTTSQVTFAADGTGTFSGLDLNGGGRVAGSFSCK
jgi:hypothetical protein